MQAATHGLKATTKRFPRMTTYPNLLTELAEREQRPIPGVNVVPIISLHQPWASLVFAKFPGDSAFVKQHETRGRKPPLKYVGGFIGIHATAKFPPAKEISADLHDLCMDVFGCSYNHTLPLGSILGVVRISGGLATAEHSPVTPEDGIAGNWSAGRFAWPLSDVMEFKNPIPAKGKQGWWKFQLPSDLYRARAASENSHG